MTRPLSVAHLSAIDTPPPRFVTEAAEAGFAAVGLRLLSSGPGTAHYPLMDDIAAMRQTRTALAESGIECHDIEFVRITPDLDLDTFGPFLDAGAALGASEIITKADDPDRNRLIDTLGMFAEQAQKRGLAPSLEFFPWTDVNNLASAVEIARSAGSGVGVLVDSLHFDRSESSLAELRALPTELVRFVHLCDAPVFEEYTLEDMQHTGRFERLPPGDGEIDLAGFLGAFPKTATIGLEVPMTTLGLEIGSAAILKKLFDTTERFLNDPGLRRPN